MTWMRRIRLAIALVGGVLALLLALAGGFAMALGNASDSGGNDPPPMPWPQSAYFPMLLLAAALALAAGPVMRWRPRWGALCGIGAVLLGIAATVICTYDVRSCLTEWLVGTLPVTVAAIMGLLDFGPRRQAAAT